MPRQKRARSTSPNDSQAVCNVQRREMAFADRYDTANKTNKEVLGKFYSVFFPSMVESLI